MKGRGSAIPLLCLACSANGATQDGVPDSATDSFGDTRSSSAEASASATRGSAGFEGGPSDASGSPNRDGSASHDGDQQMDALRAPSGDVGVDEGGESDAPMGDSSVLADLEDTCREFCALRKKFGCADDDPDGEVSSSCVRDCKNNYTDARTKSCADAVLAALQCLIEDDPCTADYCSSLMSDAGC